MNIITAYPVIMNGKVIANKFAANTMNFSSFDASGKPSTKAEIQAFQNWLDSKYPTWLNGGKLNKGSGYGTFGPSTTKAWNSYGTQFMEDYKKMSGTMIQTFGPVTTTTPTTPTTKEPSAEDQEKMKKLGFFWDKVKGVYAKGQEVGIFDNILTSLGLKQPSQAPAEVGTTTTDTTKTKQPMSKTTKTVLIVGGALVLLTIILVATKSKGKGK